MANALVDRFSPTVAAVATVGTAIVALLAANAFHKKRQRAPKEGYPLPPGPPARWFWENVMPAVNLSHTFNDWANKYGPVFTLRQGSQITIVIARVDAATEIMEKEGSALADRPPMIAASELLSRDNRITLLRSGERFRRFRKAVHMHFQAKAVSTYQDIQSEEARILILGILNDPRRHQKYAYQYAASVVLRVAYGDSERISIDEPKFAFVTEVVDHFNEAMQPGAYLVDRFPWLKYVPGYGRRLRRYHEYDSKYYTNQLNRVQRAMSSGNAGLSFSRTLLENVHDHRLSVDEMSYLAGTMFEAGSDTTSVAIIAMNMAAACFPKAQLRVQEELDLVVGRDRLPSWDDRENLPQLCAFISEVLRWRPIVPLGIPHRSTRDIIWRGHCIPAGSTVIGNLWSISRDPVAFPDAETFDPQRWIDQHGQLRNDVECYPFGFGRRVCPGIHLANRSIFITLAHLLWSFRIVERSEAPIDTTPDGDHVVARLSDFQVDFVPRMEEARLREVMVM